MPAKKYPNKSVPAIQAAIDGAVKPNYEGAAGLASMLSNILGVAATRGLMQATNLAALAQLGGADGSMAIIDGIGMYRFNPSVVVLLGESDLRGVDGTWQLIGVLSKAPYKRKIGDATATVFTITHGLNTLTPDVTVYDTLNGLPYPVSTDYDYKIVDENNIEITSDTVWGGLSRTVVVKSN